MDNYTYEATPDLAESSAMSGTIVQKQDFYKIQVIHSWRFLNIWYQTKFQVHLTAHSKTNQNSKKYDKKLTEVTFNVCTLAKETSNIFLGQIIDSFKKHSNYSFRCPNKKGTFYVANMTTGFIVFPMTRFDFSIKSTGFINLKNNKTNLKLYYFELRGYYIFPWVNKSDKNAKLNSQSLIIMESKTTIFNNTLKYSILNRSRATRVIFIERHFLLQLYNFFREILC